MIPPHLKGFAILTCEIFLSKRSLLIVFLICWNRNHRPSVDESNGVIWVLTGNSQTAWYASKTTTTLSNFYDAFIVHSDNYLDRYLWSKIFWDIPINNEAYTDRKCKILHCCKDVVDVSYATQFGIGLFFELIRINWRSKIFLNDVIFSPLDATWLDLSALLNISSADGRSFHPNYKFCKFGSFWGSVNGIVNNCTRCRVEFMGYSTPAIELS